MDVWASLDSRSVSLFGKFPSLQSHPSHQIAPSVIMLPTESEDMYNQLLLDHQQWLEETQYKMFTAEEVKDLVKDVWGRLEKYKANEDMLLTRLQDQDYELANMTDKLSEAMSRREETQLKLDSMEEDVNNVLRKLDASQLREQDYQELVSSLRRQTKALELEIEKKKKEQEELAAELGISGRSKEAFYREKERLKQENSGLKSDIVALQAMQEDLGKQLVGTQSELEEVSKHMFELKTQNADLVRDKGVLGREATNRNQLVVKLKKCLILLKTHYDALKAKLDTINTSYEEHKKGFYDLKLENKDFKSAVGIYMHEIGELNRKIHDLLTETEQIKLMDKDRERQFGELKKKLFNVEMVEVRAMRAIEKSQRIQTEMENQHFDAKQSSKLYMKEAKGLKNELKECKKKVTILERENRVANIHLLKAAELAQDTMKKFQLETQNKRSIELERDRLKHELRREFLLNISVQAEKERIRNETGSLQDKVEEGLLDIRHKEGQIIELKKELETKTNDMKKAMSLYDDAKAERNVHVTTLRETKDDNNVLKRRQKLMNRMSEQLKEQIVKKDMQLVREERVVKKKTNEVVKLDFRLTKTRSLLTTSRRLISKLEKEETQRKRFMDLSDNKRVLLERGIEKLVQDNGMIATQLDRKTAELNIMKDRVDTMEAVLKKGEAQYGQRLNDIRILRLEILKLRHEKNILLKAFENMADLRNEIYNLNKDLTQEKLKNRALEDEMETPINFHRWRFLEGTDPTKKDLLEKVHILQKKLSRCRDELNVTKCELSEANQLYKYTEGFVSGISGGDLGANQRELVMELKNELQKKEQKITTMNSEMASLDSQMEEMKYNFEHHKRETEELKKKYYDLKLKEDTRKRKEREITSKEQSDQDEKCFKQFLGGGYNMSSSEFLPISAVPL